MASKAVDIPLHIGRAADLRGRAYLLYRLFEMLPALLSWGTLLGVVLLSIYAPSWAAYLIIAFSLYWLLKTIYLSIHLRYNWKRLRYNMDVDWGKRLSDVKHEHVWHLVIFPFYKETLETAERSVQALAQAEGDSRRVMVVLAVEERAGAEAQKVAATLVERYQNTFGRMLITTHPAGVPGEMAGKGSNISYAAEEARTKLLDRLHIPYEDVIVSALDIDTVVYPKYFQCLTWYFLTTEDRQNTSFQPVPLYNNNIWNAPALARVVAVSSTFWQMIQQERPEKLSTFSSHAVSFAALHRVGYWQRNMVSEDSRIYWNMFFHSGGKHRVVPVAYPISMDANFARSFWKTMLNIYRQHRRWTWGVENVPYIIYQSVRRKTIPLRRRLHVISYQVEGFWSLATHPLILLLLGWLPIVLGSREFHVTVLSYNLPIVARTVLTVAMVGLVMSAVISLSLLPPRPKGKRKERFVFMVLEWLLVPFTMVIFSAIPGLESQTRLALGRYLGFWVTPKVAVRYQSVTKDTSSSAIGRVA